MMFDLVGLAVVGAAPLPRVPALDSAFGRAPWTTHPRNHRRAVETVSSRAVCLSRDGDADDYAVADGRELFLIGEAFPRLGGRCLGVGPLPASALLTASAEQGGELLHRIKGNFCIVLVDQPARKVLILGSHFAVSPFYYAVNGGVVYFSTSLAELGRLPTARPEIDLAAVVETVVLNWPMQERTFLTGVKRIGPGTIVTIKQDGATRRTYWDQRPLYDAPALPAPVALEQGSELFHHCANSLASDQPRICASFTSGFDSRALQAVLDVDRDRMLGYAFGVPGSVNVSIPARISSDLGYRFEPFYLDRRFEDVFDDYAAQTVTLSDGFVVQRANYPYAFERLSGFAPVVVTGIFGSEFLRTFQNLGEFVSPDFARINRADEPMLELRRLLGQRAGKSYVRGEAFRSALEEVEADVFDWFRWCKGFNADQRLHLYLIAEASRKYFGAEISTERVYATNRFPFLDVDFFELIFRAPFAGVHSRAISPTIANRFDSQYFYAYLIRKYRPELLPYPTDHGYAPADLLTSRPLLHAGRKHVLSRAWRRLCRYREFRPEAWLEQFYRRRFADHRSGGASLDFDFVSPQFRNDYRSGRWLTNLSAFDKVAALQIWLAEWY